jgi:hypothetical protein
LRRNLIQEVKTMKTIAAILLAVLLAVGLSVPGPNSLFATDDAEAREELEQEEEKIDDDFKRFLEEEMERSKHS